MYYENQRLTLLYVAVKYLIQSSSPANPGGRRMDAAFCSFDFDYFYLIYLLLTFISMINQSSFPQ